MELHVHEGDLKFRRVSLGLPSREKFNSDIIIIGKLEDSPELFRELQENLNKYEFLLLKKLSHFSEIKSIKVTQTDLILENSEVSWCQDHELRAAQFFRQYFHDGPIKFIEEYDS